MRIIFNTSFIVEENIEQEWITFMHRNYISDLQGDKWCEDVIFTKVSIDQPEGKTYSVQVVFKDEHQQHLFMEQYLPAFEEKISQQYANHYLCFSSVLTEI